MKMRSLYFSIILLFIAASGFAQTDSVVISGIVFEDRNGNGIKDRKERPIASTPLSDGETVVLTDKKGEYTLLTTIGSSVFAITPSDFAYADGSRNENSKFLYLSDRTFTYIRYNIALVKRKSADNFRIGAIGDVQVGDIEELEYAGKTIFAELAGRDDIDFNIFLGDQVNDNTSLFAEIGHVVESLPMPSWSVLGNHDRIYDKDFPHDRDFNLHFGASHYAFNYGDVHFIVLNNVYSEGNERKYKGFVSPKQLKFIENDLRYVPKNKTIVLCQHIPMEQTGNRDDVFELLADRTRVLILSGHTHQVERHIFSPSVQEITVGATCGSWWVGERDIWGIPTALMQCGTPRGYFTVDFSGNNYTFEYKGIGLDNDIQMDICTATQEVVGIEADQQNNLVIANIYGGAASTNVRMSIDGGEWLHMKNTPIVAPSVSHIISLNEEGVYPTKYSRKIPFRKRNSPHIWTALLPEDLTSGVHIIRVAAEDEHGFSAEGSTYILIR